MAAWGGLGGMLGKMKRPEDAPTNVPKMLQEHLKKLGRLAHGFGGVMASGGEGKTGWMRLVFQEVPPPKKFDESIFSAWFIIFLGG